ncbi:MAG TPA: peptidoglycan DD-metalloendopeptidase family protein [Rhodocyclaceae bacterium]|nr:peptidoglycan DD-metalloendopeptidase family protein [Rhodocyclaceae bacterium]
MEKSGILTQSPKAFERFERHRWTLALGGAFSALGMAAAIAVANPDEGTANVKTVIEQLAVQGAKPVELGDTGFLREERIQRGDTLGAILMRLGVQEPEALEFVRTSPETRVMHQQLVPGKVVSAQTTDSGELRTLYFPLNGKDATLVVERLNGRLAAHEKALRFETQTVMKTGEIRTSLFGATDDAGIPDAVATQMAEIFSGDIDFHRDLRKSDRFTVIYEMQYLSGQPARAGRILAAEFVNNGKSFRAVQFMQDGRSAYYSPEGKSLRKAFLRSPLEFSRVTSGFAMRFHPILQQWRAHKGVDYGAPPGTKVRATGDGTVDFAALQGGYGKLVVIKHNGNYSTAYGHLKDFGPGIRKGARVSQGETIGYVGQTGWATGPHLHYEFRINSQPVNPLALNLPTSVPLEASQLARFKAEAAPLATRLDLLRNTNLAALD